MLLKQIRITIPDLQCEEHSEGRDGSCLSYVSYPSLRVPPPTTMSYLLNSAKGYTYVEW